MIVFVLFRVIFKSDIIQESPQEAQLEKDGYVWISQLLSEKDVSALHEMSDAEEYGRMKEFMMNHKVLQERILSELPDYVFQDYIFIIKKSNIHTCHRDNNSHHYNEGQQFPSYTILIFLEDMEKALGVIPESHKNKWEIHFLRDPIIHVPCNRGDALLFDANLVHAGSINTDSMDHLRIQMKITHREDVSKIAYYENYNKVLKEDNMWPTFFLRMQQSLTCMFPFFSNYTTDGIKKMSETGESNFIQKMFSFFVSGKSDFYDLDTI
jgi:hypothetical protein